MSSGGYAPFVAETVTLAQAVHGVELLLTADERHGFVAVCVNGQHVHIFSAAGAFSAEIDAASKQRHRMPTDAVLLQWAPRAADADAALLVVTTDGSAYLLEVPRGDKPPKRERDEEAVPWWQGKPGTTAKLPARFTSLRVGDAERLAGLPPLGPLHCARLLAGGLLVWRDDGAHYVPLPESITGEPQQQQPPPPPQPQPPQPASPAAAADGDGTAGPAAPSLALPALGGWPGLSGDTTPLPLVLAVTSSTEPSAASGSARPLPPPGTSGLGGLGAGVLEAPLYYAIGGASGGASAGGFGGSLGGGSGASCLVIHGEMGDVRLASLASLGPSGASGAAAPHRPLSASAAIGSLGEPAAAAFLSHAPTAAPDGGGGGGGAQAAEPAAAPPADTVVVLGRGGGLLLLTAGGVNGEVRRHLWRLPTSGIVIGGCLIGRLLIVLSLKGAYVHTLPEPPAPAAAGRPTPADGNIAAAASAATAALAASAKRKPAGKMLGRTSAMVGVEADGHPLAISPAPFKVCALPTAHVMKAAKAALAEKREHSMPVGFTGARSGGIPVCTLGVSGQLDFLALAARAAEGAYAPPGKAPQAGGKGAATSAAAGGGGGGGGGSGGGAAAAEPTSAQPTPPAIPSIILDSIENFEATHDERLLRERLKRIGESAEMLAEQQRALEAADEELGEVLDAYHTMRALVCAGPAAVKTRITEGWCLVTLVVMEQPLGGGQELTHPQALGDGGGKSDGVHSTQSRSTPLAGLPAKGKWTIELPLPSTSWQKPPTLHVLLCYRPPDPSIHGGPPAKTAAALVSVKDLQLVQTLRRRNCRPPVQDENPTELQMMRELAEELELRDPPEPRGGGSSGGGTSAGGGGAVPGAAAAAGGGGGASAEGPTQCKLRLLPSTPSRTPAECLEWLLEGGAYTLTAPGGRSGGSAKQLTLNLELPDGTDTTLRISTEGSTTSAAAALAAATGAAGTPPPAPLLLLLQCDEPGPLWALRASALQRLGEWSVGSLRPPPRDASAPPRAPPTADGEAAAGGGGAGAGAGAGGGAAEPPDPTATRLLETLKEEVKELLPQLRKWQREQITFYESVFRLYEFRRTLDAGGGGNLAEMSLEAKAQMLRLIEMHAAIRGQLGCLSLPI